MDENRLHLADPGKQTYLGYVAEARPFSEKPGFFSAENF